MSRPTIICLTPVKNDAWILKRILACASLWADHIVVLDQHSQDDSRAIARQFPKVTLVENQDPEYNELGYRHQLLAAARKFEGPRLLISLDSDEVLTASALNSPEWETMLQCPPGTAIYMDWINLKPDFKRCWLVPGTLFGLMDDGGLQQGGNIHIDRMPRSQGAPRLILKDLKVMHYQYTDWGRMHSKHCWYQCFELVNHPGKAARNIFRQYHHMYRVKPGETHTIKPEWFAGYEQKGIDMTSTLVEQFFIYDRWVLDFFEEYGTRHFAKLNIWGRDWVNAAQVLGYDDPQRFIDPRGAAKKAMHLWLRGSQKLFNRFWLRQADRLMGLLPGW